MSQPMLDRQEILAAVQVVLRESLNEDDLEVSEFTNTDLENSLHVDSADYLDIICRLEQRFQIPQPEAKGVKRILIATFRTVGDICEYAEQQLASQQLVHT